MTPEQLAAHENVQNPECSCAECSAIRELAAEVRRLTICLECRDDHDRQTFFGAGLPWPVHSKSPIEMLAFLWEQAKTKAEAAEAEAANLRQAIKTSGFEVMQTSGGWSIHDVSEKTKVDEQKTAELISRNIELEIEVEKLKAVIVRHDLCHDLHGRVGAEDFAAGCATEQRKLYGRAPDADEVIQLNNRISNLKQALVLAAIPLRYIYEEYRGNGCYTSRSVAMTPALGEALLTAITKCDECTTADPVHDSAVI